MGVTRLGILGVGLLCVCATGLAEHASFRSVAHATSGVPLSTAPARPRLVGSDKSMGAPGVNYGMSEAEVKALIAQRSIDVPFYAQEGDTCGLYGLKMIMGYHHKRDSRNLLPRAKDNDAVGDRGHYSLYTYAKDNGHLLKDAGDTSQWGLADLADAYGYSAKSKNDPIGPDVDDLKEELAKGNPVLVCVKRVDQGTGRPVGGGWINKEGHWVVVEGFAKASDGTEYVVVKHGWSGGSVIWRVDEFESAWKAKWSPTVYVRPKY